MAKKTVEQLNAELINLQNKKDEYLVAHRKKAKALRLKRDKAIFAEQAKSKVAQMSDEEIEAVKAELGVK